jgi:hypothetical protein
MSTAAIDALTERITARILARTVANSQRKGVAFGEIEILILSAIVSAVVSWFVEHLLDKHCDQKSVRNPGWLAKWRLRRAIGRLCENAQKLPQAIQLTRIETGASRSFDRRYGELIHAACLQEAYAAQEHEVAALLATRC